MSTAIAPAQFNTERPTPNTNMNRRPSLTTFQTNGCGKKKGKCSRNWFYVPFVNIFVEYFSATDPPTPDELSQSLEVTGLASALYISMIAGSTQSFGHDDFESAFLRLGINSTNGGSDFIDAVDPYSFFINSTCESINAFSCSLLITCLIIFHQSSVDFNDPHGNYSTEIRGAWWSFIRFPMILNFGFLCYGCYKSTESYQMLAMMMMPNIGGSVMPDGPRQLVAGVVFDSDWTTTHKFNFAAMFLFSLGWYFGVVGILITFSTISCALANKHKKFQQLLKDRNILGKRDTQEFQELITFLQQNNLILWLENFIFDGVECKEDLVHIGSDDLISYGLHKVHARKAVLIFKQIEKDNEVSL
jgi:hypothetical protein